MWDWDITHMSKAQPRLDTYKMTSLIVLSLKQTQETLKMTLQYVP